MPWSSRLELREQDTDYLGHVTAAAHLKLLEEARTAWLASVMDDRTPAFVVARQELDYRRELLLRDGPVTVTVQPLRCSRSTVTVHEAMTSAGGVLHTESHAVLARWDREARRSMPFPTVERERIARDLPRPRLSAAALDGHADSGQAEDHMAVELDPRIRALLEGPNIAHLSTVMADGGPHAVAIWVMLVEHDRLAFVVDPRSLKGRNLKHDPRVAFSIVDHENAYRTAQLRGRVVATGKGDAAIAAVHAMSQRYTGVDYRDPGGVLYEAEIDRAVFADLTSTVAR